MQHDTPEYRKFFGATHNSASGATQPLDEHVLKLKIRKEFLKVILRFAFGSGDNILLIIKF